jgi:acetylornithine deacetylase/succinyl-diaminopimelate desuccinylase-like protein
MANKDKNNLDLQNYVEKALGALDEDSLVKFSMDLTEIPSPTGQEEEMAQFLHEHISQAGLKSILQPIKSGRSNVLGTYEGYGGGRSLMFLGHLDTPVGIDNNINYSGQPPKARTVDKDWILGRGISNMKGALAVYLYSINAVKSAGIKLSGDVLMAGVAGGFMNNPVDEFQDEKHKGYGIGTQNLLKLGGLADMCVLGEPTSFDLITQNYGWNHVRIDLENKDIFDRKDNIIEVASELVQAFKEWIPEYQKKNTINNVIPAVKAIAVKSGFPWRGDGFPTSVSLFYVVTTKPKVSPKTVKPEVRKVLNRAMKRYPNFKTHVELYGTNPGAFIPEDSPIVKAIKESHSNIFKKEPEVGAVYWFSDAGHLNRHGVPTVNYGVGPRKDLHISKLLPLIEEYGSRIEYLHRDDLINCARVYIDLICRACLNPIK